MNKVREVYKITELGEIPSDWNIMKLSEVAEIVMGQSPDSSSYNDIEDGVAFFQGKTEFGRINPVVKKWCNNPTKISKPLDILISVRAPVGDVNINNIEACIGRGLGAIRAASNSNYKYLYYAIQKYNNQLKKASQGSTFEAINSNDLKGLKLPIPHIDEQEKIALILSTVDEQIDNVAALIEKNRELKKGLMQTLLTKGIGHKKFKKTEIGEIPEEWEIKTFKDISKVTQGLQIAIEERYKELKEGRLPYITIQYINDKLNSDNEYFIENFSESVVCKEDDILMTRTGNTGIVVTNQIGVFHNNFFKVDFRRDLLNKDFLVWFLNTSFMQNLIIRYAGTTTIPDLKHGDFYKLPVVIPSLEEQEKIASILSEVDKKIGEYKNKKQKLEELKRGLMQQLLGAKIRVNINV